MCGASPSMTRAEKTCRLRAAMISAQVFELGLVLLALTVLVPQWVLVPPMSFG